MDEGGLHVSKGYYINLEARLDRREHMERLVAKLHWPVRRFNAHRLESDPSEHGLVMRPGLRGARAVASIWLSHLAVRRTFASSESPGNFLLLEDDVFIRNGLWGQSYIPCSGLPDEWDILLFSPRYRLRQADRSRTDAPRFVDPPFGLEKPNFLPDVAKTHFCTGAHFCIIRDADAARRICARMKSAAQIYDVDQFYATENISYGVSSPFITAGGFGSDHI